MVTSIAISRKIMLAYAEACKPLCRELDLPQTAFDILMFLGNNPECKTAAEIVEVRHIKANLVSVNVERLVADGYIERRAVNGDRRKNQLICTEKSAEILKRGQALQAEFTERLFANMCEDIRRGFLSATEIIENNLDELLREEK